MVATSSADLVAAFLAKGGAIAKVEVGAGANLTGRQWANAVRGNAPAKVSRYDDDAEYREETAREAFHEARHCGASMSAAMDDYNYVRNARRR